MIFSPNERYLAVLSNDIYVFDLIKRTVKTLPATRQALYEDLAAVFSKDGSNLLSASHNIYSVDDLPADTTNKEVRFIPDRTIGSAFYLIGEPGVLKQWKANDGKEETSFFIPPGSNVIGDATALLLDDDGKTVFIGTSDNRVLRMDLSASTITASKMDHNSMVFALERLPGKRLLISASKDGTIKLRNDSTLEVVATLFALKNNGYIITDSSFYYKRSKNGANAILFEKNGNIFQPEQYDIYFNQPHQVLQHIGLSSEGLIKLFSDLHRKKLAAQGTSAVPDLSKLITADVANILDIPAVTTDKQLMLQMNISATNTTATKLVATVNGVPVVNDTTLQVKAGSSTTTNIQLPLAKGINNISVKVFDNNGISSAETILKITCKPAQSKRADLYIIVASISQYQDSTMNLKLAAKDGEDFLKLWKQDGKKSPGFPSHFGNVYQYSFFNNTATKENILAVRDSFAKAKEEDMVVLYLSGHGLLDSSFNFWFATHDINFNDPAKRGLSYKNLEGILEGIKPLRKIMLMDACHSGELDKSLLAETRSGKMITGTRSKVKEYRYNGTVVKEAKDLGNTFEQMQEMFNKLNAGSGTIVIAASAGNGYAYEDAKWNNGVFTYAILNGLRSKAADSNKDGDITIEELSAFVSKEVASLTNGLQKPNERQENSVNSFRIW
jgi:WD40 repeat protein